jgi:hypothetical protein
MGETNMQRLVITFTALAMGAVFAANAHAKGGGADIAEQRAKLKQEQAEQRARSTNNGPSLLESLFDIGATESGQAKQSGAQ